MTSAEDFGGWAALYLFILFFPLFFLHNIFPDALLIGFCISIKLFFIS